MGHRNLSIKDNAIYFAGMILFAFKSIFLPRTVVWNAHLLGISCKEPWTKQVHLIVSCL